MNVTGGPSGEQLLFSTTNSLLLNSLSCCASYSYSVSSQTTAPGVGSSMSSSPLAFQTLPDTSSKLLSSHRTSMNVVTYDITTPTIYKDKKLLLFQ